MVRTALFSLALVFALHAAAHAQIDWKFTPGERFYVHEASKVAVTIDFDLGDSEKSNMQVDLVRSVEVLGATADGGILLRERVESMKVTDDNGVQNTGPLEGAEFTIAFDKDMQVVGFGGYDELVERLAGPLAADQEAVRAALPKQELVRALSETYNIYLPGRAVSQGDQWSAVRTVKGPPVGTLSMDLTYTVQGPTDHQGVGVQRIDFSGLTSIKGLSEGPVKADFDRVQLTGEVLFNSDLGKLAQLNLRGTIEGRLTIENLLDSASGDCRLELEQTITVSETRPEI